MRKEPMKIGDLLKKYNLLVLLIVFNLVGLASFYQQIAKGIIIIAALLLNRAIDAKK